MDRVFRPGFGPNAAGVGRAVRCLIIGRARRAMGEELGALDEIRVLIGEFLVSEGSRRRRRKLS